MSGKRRAGGPVRQLSLQQSQRKQLRKQVSEGYWGDHGLRVLASSLVSQEPPPRREAQPAVVRPRPVRIAWTERRQVSCEGDLPVGVVVQRCKGLPRPVTAKPAKVSAPPDTILYSRQQLAERLRLAWRERQERPNLDIFLAHNSVDKGDEEAVIGVREVVTQVENCTEDVINTSFDPLSDIVNTNFVEDALQKRRFRVSSVQTFPTAVFPLAAFRESDPDKKTVTKPVKPKLTPSITISFDHEEDANDNEPDEEVPPPDSSTSEHLLKPESHSRIEDGDNKLPVSDSEGKKDEKVKEPDKQKQENLTATMRRANFRNSSNSPVMTGSLCVSPAPPATSPPQTTKPILKKSSNQPLTRMMSAPAAGRSASRGHLARDGNVKTDRPDLENDEDQNVVQRERNIKSAPARRRFKGRARKGPKSHEDDSSEEENYDEPLPAPAKPRNRKRFVERGADIVTMVSLLSPNESEAEDVPEPVVQLPQELPWTRPPGSVGLQDSKPSPTPTTAPASAPTATTATTASTPTIVCLRKLPAKTVSFQQGGARSYTASFPSRRGAGSPHILPPSEPPPTLPPSTETTPAPPPAIARRRLVKAKSAGDCRQWNTWEVGRVDIEALAREQRPHIANPTSSRGAVSAMPPLDYHDFVPSQESSCGSEPLVEVESEQRALTPPPTTVLATIVEPPPDPDAEPPFKTDKERQCWQMFRKMADKGVAVSYDTVLRGMLTPTEYRLHKKSMSSAC